MRRIRSENFTISHFYCTQCKKEGIPIPRRDCQQREPGHLKQLYCIYCGKDTNHVEVRPFGSYTYEDFSKEYELGRFTKDGTRVPVKDLKICKCNCECNVNGRCWNTNGSYKYCAMKEGENS